MNTQNTSFPGIEAPPLVTNLLETNTPVAFGVSGGKDSSVMALATSNYLNTLGHQGPRILIHSDLGRVEWKDSLPMCQRLSERLGLELVVVHRQAGDLMDRWLTRWHNNVQRYTNLECVKLILPWSTASLRFCTSELKTSVICRELVNRFQGQTILSVAGLRREESPARAKAPIVLPQVKLISAPRGTSGYSWHPILNWKLEDIQRYHRAHNFPLHEAYVTYGTSRVSCAFCMLGSHGDLTAASTCRENESIYKEMVQLEITSTFSFQEQQWLGDIAPQLLDNAVREELQDAKQRAVRRIAIEKRIPRHLLYSKGWPTVLPTRSEARLLGEIRQEIANIVRIPVRYTDPDAILERYTELLTAKPLHLIQRENTLPRQQLLWTGSEVDCAAS